MAGAAFFDLDRTILLGPSSTEINDALVAAGLAPDRKLPGIGVLGEFYRRFGETIPFMALARAAAIASRGWSADAAAVAAEQAAKALEAKVAPYARALIAEHQAAGRPAVLASTSPEHLIRPLADDLGFDDVVATRYSVEDGKFTGGLDGGFVWATGKLDAVRRWASSHGVSLADSYAYSDSIYDVPLLSAVGHPVAVNPDPRLRVASLALRWPQLWLDVPPGVPKLAGREPYDVVRMFSRPELFPYARFDIEGVDRIPHKGGGIIVANHRSYFDVAALGVTVSRAGRSLRFLGKKEVFDAPVIGPMAKALGGIRVDRGSGSAGPLEEAERAVRGGEVVALMPQGTIPRGPAFFDPMLQGRPGAARLAAATGAPVIPIGIWGTENVWARSSRLPNVTNVLSPPTVRVRVGQPVEGLTGEVERDTEKIMSAISALLPSEARRQHEPTPEELARTYPRGAPSGD
jgi:putative phosphoserine phosphatase/1-acylglycerol-3-phosphate O-acyltransferase